MTKRGGKIEWFIHDGDREIGPLSEIELRKRLRRGRRDKLRVRQTDGPWHPAKDVVRKFRELAENGIYIKLASVAGPYTAEKAFAILSRLSLDGVTAKIGLHGSWVPAERLFEKLQNAIDKANSQANETDAADDKVVDLPPMTATEIEDQDEDVGTLMPLDDDDDLIGADSSDDPLQLAAETMVVEPLADIEPLPTVEPLPTIEQIPTVEPVAGEPIPTVEPIANPIPVVQPINEPVLVEPIQPIPVVVPVAVPSQAAHRPSMHFCACGREVRVMPQHVGMTMQCPACKRTFVAR